MIEDIAEHKNNIRKVKKHHRNIQKHIEKFILEMEESLHQKKEKTVLRFCIDK